MVELMLFRMVSVALLILANGFFVAAEFALVSVRETRIERLITLGRPGARAVRRLQENMEDFLPAVQLGVTLCSLALGWIGEPAVATLFEHWFQGMPYARVYAHLLAVPIAFALITYLHVLLGELVPKSLALRKAEVLAVAVAGPMDVFIRLTRPVVRLMKRSARVVLRLFGTEMMQGGEVDADLPLVLRNLALQRTHARDRSVGHGALLPSKLISDQSRPRGRARQARRPSWRPRASPGRGITSGSPH